MTEAQKRKDTPIYSGVLNYFPDAIAAVARVSKVGNDQHNPGTALHWDRSKSKDEYDACARHLLDRASGEELDTDGQRHMAKVAWRALAALQKELEQKVENSKSQKIAEPVGATAQKYMNRLQYSVGNYANKEWEILDSRGVVVGHVPLANGGSKRTALDYWLQTGRLE